MALSPVKTFIAEVLTFSDLNAMNTNILNNANSLISPFTADVSAGSFKLTTLAAGTALTDAPTLQQVQYGFGSFLTSVAGTNTITATATPTPAYTVGQRFTFVPAVTNTGATTLNISSVGAGAVQLLGAALTGGELQASLPVTVYVSAATPVFQIIQPTQFTDARALVVGATDATKKLRFEVDGFTTGTTRVLTLPDANLTLPAITAAGDGIIGTAADTAARAALIYGKIIHGLTYDNGTDATNDININTGGAMDATGARWMRLATALGKQSDVAWAVGGTTGAPAGMLDTGVVGNSDYWLWLIARSDTGVVDVLSSLSATAPSMPANYDFKRRIGWFRRLAGAIVLFTTTETAGGGYELLYTTPPEDFDSTTTTSRTLITLAHVPPSMVAKFRVTLSHATLTPQIVIQEVAETDAAPSPTASPSISLQSAVANTSAGGEFFKRVDTSQQIAIRSTQTTSETQICTISFTDDRRT